MTIYATPFKASSKETTGPSTDSDFQSLDDVVAAMGEPLKRYKRMVIYGPGDHVIDCFNGSGSSGVASLLSGCRYTGIEREPKYVEVTRNRLENFADELPSIDEVGTTG